MRNTRIAAVAALALVGGARAAPPPEDARKTLAEYRLEVERLVAQEERAARGSRTGLAPETSSPAATRECRLMKAGADGTTSRDCVGCHRASGRDNHPVDLDYERARYGAGRGLRPLGEVVKRGVFLPNGELRCVTCHDGRSPWKHRIALPPGAQARPAVNPRDRATYEARRATAAPLQRGSAVTAMPLCLACHAFD